MNCRPGDLAIIIRGPNLGLSLTCLELAPCPPELGAWAEGDPVWRVDRKLTWTLWGDIDGRPGMLGTRCVPYCSDSRLMPIRPDGLKIEPYELMDVS